MSKPKVQTKRQHVIGDLRYVMLLACEAEKEPTASNLNKRVSKAFGRQLARSTTYAVLGALSGLGLIRGKGKDQPYHLTAAGVKTVKQTKTCFDRVVR